MAQLKMPAPVQPKTCPIKSMRIDREGHARGYWVARVPLDHTLKDVEAPGYFAPFLGTPAVPKFGDDIEIENLGITWWARLRVMAVVPQIKVIKVVVLEERDFSREAPPGYAFEWGGESELWRVLKGKVVVAQHCSSHDECIAAIDALKNTISDAA